MSVLVLTVILLCGVLIAWWRMRPRHRSPPLLHGALPLIGHAHHMIGDSKHLLNYIQEIQMYSLKKGGLCEGWLGPHSVYILTDPEDSLTLANSCFNKPYIYDFTKEWINNGLITSEASIWKNHRKLLNPAFNQQVLNTYVDEMQQQARHLVSQFASKVGKDSFDVRKYVTDFTLSSVARTSLGLNTQDQARIDTDYAEAIEDLSTVFCDRLRKCWLHLSIFFDWSPLKRKQDKLTNKLKGIIDQVINKRKSELKNKKNTMNGDSLPDKFKPVLDRLLHLAEEQDTFTDDDIREHLDTIVAAAFDTTSSAMTAMLLLIGSHQDVQDRIFNELQEVLKHKNDDLTKQDLAKLVYLEAVIKESLRMYPAVPIIARKVDKDVHLRKVYSMMLMKTALAHIVRRYHVTGDINKVVWEFAIVIKPVEGHHIGLTLRT